MRRRWWVWLIGGIAGLTVVTIGLSFFIDEPLRRYIQSQAGEYPSPIQMQAIIFDSGKLWLDGHADFLAIPHVALKAQLGLENVDLAYVKPLARRYSVVLSGGTLSGAGDIEYTASLKVAHLQTATVRGL